MKRNGWLAFLILGPDVCLSRHPADSKVRCGSATHGPDRAHLNGWRMWDEHGDIPLCNSRGARATPAEIAAHEAEVRRVEEFWGREAAA